MKRKNLNSKSKLQLGIILSALILSMCGCSKSDDGETTKSGSAKSEISVADTSDSIEDGTDNFEEDSENLADAADNLTQDRENSADAADNSKKAKESEAAADVTQKDAGTKGTTKAEAGTKGTTKADTGTAKSTTKSESTAKSTAKSDTGTTATTAASDTKATAKSDSTAKTTTKADGTTKTTAKSDSTAKTTTAASSSSAPNSNSSVTNPVPTSDMTDKADAKAASIVSSIITAGMSEYDKVLAIHNYLLTNVEYDTNYDSKSVYDSIYKPEGALCNGLAVCQGYADAFSLLCYKAGIQTELVYGSANNGSFTQSHAWNLVRIDNVWYEVDVTWDDPVGISSANNANITYKYFLITDADMNKDHVADDYTNKYSCTSTKYYEAAEKLSLNAFVQSSYGTTDFTIIDGTDSAKNVAAAKKSAGAKSFIVAYKYKSASDVGSEVSSLWDVIGKTINANCGMEMLTRDDSPYVLMKITIG